MSAVIPHVTHEEQHERWRKQRAVELKKKGLEDDVICERLGMSRASLLNALRRQEVEGRVIRGPEKPWTEEEAELARSLKREGHTLDQIGRMLGRTRGSIAGKLYVSAARRA